jgi:hypothetical protein
MGRRPYKYIILVILGLALAAGVLALPRVSQFLKIDKCLDRGGIWDYQRNICTANADQERINRCILSGGQWDFETRKCGEKGDVHN